TRRDCGVVTTLNLIVFFFSGRRRHTRFSRDWSSDVCSSDLLKLFHKVGGWTAIPDLMIGTIDENENIRQLAFGYLQIWRARAVRSEERRVGKECRSGMSPD